MTLPHGGNIYYYSRKYGIPAGSILDFSASINPLGPSPKALKAISDAAGSLVNYPDPECSALTGALAAYHGISPESILAGNGSTELIYLIPRVLGGKSALVLSPGFSDYERAAKLAGMRVRRLMLKPQANFVPDTGKLINALPGTDLLFLCNPNNPTGVLLNSPTVLDILSAAKKAGTFVIVDEAFMEYAPDSSVIAYAASHAWVAVLRNFTKFHGMPGLRAGYAVAHPRFIAKSKTIKEPWSVNTLAQEAAVASLSDHEYMHASLKLVEAEKQFLHAALCSIPGLEPLAPSVNFMLVKLSTGPGAGILAEELASKGILVRDCTNFRGLGDRYIRVAVRNRTENETLAAAIKSSGYFTGR